MTDFDSVPLVKSDEESSTFWEIWQNRLVEPDPALNDNVGDNVGLLLLNLLVIVPLTLLFAYPLTLSATLLMTRAGVTGETISMKAALKQALSRVWPLAGSTFVFGLFISGILVILTVLFMVVGISIVGMATVDDSDLSPLALIGWLIGGYIALIITVVVVSSFFVIRWGFYLPVVLLDHEGLGVGKSWKMTKGNFWRLAALYLVVTVIYTIFSGGISALSLVVFGTSILSKLIQVLVSCLLMPWMMIVYALSYLDLKLRYEGTDVEALLKRQAAASAAAELNGSHD